MWVKEAYPWQHFCWQCLKTRRKQEAERAYSPLTAGQRRFAIMARDMKTFSKEAKEYGILYAAVMNRKSTDGIVDVVVSANDAARVNRIAERFALSTIEIQKTSDTPAKERTADAQNPTARTDSRNPSAPSSGSKEHFETADADSKHARSSVRQQLRDIHQERQNVRHQPIQRNKQMRGELRL